MGNRQEPYTSGSHERSAWSSEEISLKHRGISICISLFGIERHRPIYQQRVLPAHHERLLLPSLVLRLAPPPVQCGRPHPRRRRVRRGRAQFRAPLRAGAANGRHPVRCGLAHPSSQPPSRGRRSVRRRGHGCLDFIWISLHFHSFFLGISLHFLAFS